MYELSEAAAEDIETILERSIVDFGILQTERYIESLQHCLDLLGEHPQMGASAEDIRPGYRRFVHRSHVIFYRETERGIFVARMLHKHMDAARHL